MNSVASASLAQVSPVSGPADAGQATTWLIVLIVVILAAFMVAGIVVYIVRSRVLKARTTSDGLPLTLADVRRMRERGEIDDEEMARLKGIVTGRAKKDQLKPPQAGGVKTE